MSEQLNNHEQHTNGHENLVSKEQIKHNHERAVELARKAQAEHAERDNRALLQEVEKHATEAKHNAINSHTSEQRDDTALPGVQQSMKDRTYKREVSKIQSKLAPASRRFSKLVHNKTVESISNVGAKTVARPSGVLGGSIVAFLGSLVTYYMARHYGFRYNYLMMVILFAAGFAAGAVIELFVWSFTRKRNSY